MHRSPQPARNLCRPAAAKWHAVSMMPKVSQQAIAEYDAVAAGLEAAGVVQGSMVGMAFLEGRKEVGVGDVRGPVAFQPAAGGRRAPARAARRLAVRPGHGPAD